MNAYEAKNHALEIAGLCEQYDAKTLTYEDWSIRMRAAWRKVDLDEPCQIGSDCHRRMLAVKRALGKLGTAYA